MSKKWRVECRFYAVIEADTMEEAMEHEHVFDNANIIDLWAEELEDE